MKMIKRYLNGNAHTSVYWLIGLPGTIAFAFLLYWTSVQISAIAYQYGKSVPDELLLFPKQTLLSSFLLIYNSVLIVSYYSLVYRGTFKAAYSRRGWTSNALWMGLGGHIAVTLGVIVISILALM